MPVRSLNSFVLIWPGALEVDRAARAWAERQAATRPEVVAIGYFGSYARGESGPGSDLDLLAIVRASDRPFAERGSGWELRGLPVAAEILLYTEDEWERFRSEGGRFAQALARDTVWMVGNPRGSRAAPVVSCSRGSE